MAGIFHLYQHHDPTRLAETLAALRELTEGVDGLALEPVPREVEAEARHVAAQLLAQQPARAEVTSTAGGGASTDVQSVDVDSLALTRPRSVGVEQLALSAMEAVDFEGEMAASARWSYNDKNATL